MTVTESLTGFVLIAWSASFTFVEMQRSGNNDSGNNEVTYLTTSASRGRRGRRRASLAIMFVSMIDWKGG
jgi:hypothetical protein